MFEESKLPLETVHSGLEQKSCKKSPLLFEQVVCKRSGFDLLLGGEAAQHDVEPVLCILAAVQPAFYSPSQAGSLLVLTAGDAFGHQLPLGTLTMNQREA